MKLSELLQEQADSLRQGREFAVVTIIEARNLARTNGKMLVYPDGSISGTVGGGMWEKSAIHDALSCLKDGRNAVKTYDFQGKLARAGFQCDGVLTVFIECCRSDSLQLVVVGGGHVGNAVLHAAKAVGFATTLVDTRGKSEIGDSIETADRFIPVQNFGDVASLQMPENAYYVVSTYGHMVDGEALSGVLKHPDACYIGMLGSHKKIHAVFSQLEQEGIDRAALAKIHAPIGLDLGGETPEELAVSIIAEILAIKNDRPGGYLSI